MNSLSLYNPELSLMPKGGKKIGMLPGHRKQHSSSMARCESHKRDRRTDRQTDGQTDGHTDGQTDGQRQNFLLLSATKRC